MEREGFVFYRSFAEAIEILDDETRLKCYDAIVAYGIHGEEPELDGFSRTVFTLVKPQLDANNKRYLDGLKGAEFGKLGGRPKKNPIGVIDKNPIGVTEKTPKEKDKEKEKVKEKDKEKENVKDKEKSREKTTVFIPPSFEEVNEYCTERKNGVNPQAFIDFYTAKGWLIGKSKMKDWKAAVRTWERRDLETTRITPIDTNKAKIDDFFRRNMGL